MNCTNKNLARMGAVFLATLLLGGAIAFAAATAASFASETPLHGRAETGEVAFSIETSGEESGRIELGETYDRAYAITNEGSDCYVRLTAQVKMEELEATLVQDGGANEDWVLGDDEMWYYTKPLGPGETVTFNGKLYFPVLTDWMKDLTIGGDHRIKEVVTGHAVQAANMPVDFTAGAPWGSISADTVVEETNSTDERQER